MHSERSWTVQRYLSTSSVVSLIMEKKRKHVCDNPWYNVPFLLGCNSIKNNHKDANILHHAYNTTQ